MGPWWRQLGLSTTEALSLEILMAETSPQRHKIRTRMVTTHGQLELPLDEESVPYPFKTIEDYYEWLHG